MYNLPSRHMRTHTLLTVLRTCSCQRGFSASPEYTAVLNLSEGFFFTLPLFSVWCASIFYIRQYWLAILDGNSEIGAHSREKFLQFDLIEEFD